jgi:hypothetical protein
LDLGQLVALMLLGVLGHIVLVLCDGTDTSQAGVQAQEDYDQSGGPPREVDASGGVGRKP